MKNFLLISIFLFSMTGQVSAENPSFCDDPKSQEYFEELVKKYPNDVPLQILHALRIGLCVKIKQNSISETEAINLFNDTVDAMAKKRGKDEKQDNKKEL